MDADGWFHSGDIGFIREDNHAVQVIDRIKNIFKLSQGEYIAVEKVENVYLQNELVDQICVYGDSTQNYIVAVVVPKKAKLVDLVQQSTLEDSMKQKCFEDLCANREVRELVLSELNKTALEAKVSVVLLVQRSCLASSVSETSIWNPPNGPSATTFFLPP